MKDRKIWMGLLFLAMPFFLCMLYTLKDGKFIWDAFMPANANGPWSDEVFYYKQIEGMIHHGIPQGFFGYGEGKAKLLSFGPWSPLLLIPYAIVGKVISWGYAAPIWCNIIFFTGVFLVILLNSDRKEYERLLYCTIALFSLDMVVRYLLSGMVEPVCIALAVAMAGMLHGCRWKERNYGIIVGMYIASILLTFMRPYNIVFFMFPFYFIVRNVWGKYKTVELKKGIVMLIAGIAVPIVTLAGYFSMMKNFCAMQLFSFGAITPPISESVSQIGGEQLETVAVQSPWLQYIQDMWSNYSSGLHSIGQEIKYVISGGEGAMGKCWLFLAIAILFLLICLVVEWKRKQWEKLFIDGMTLLAVFLILSGIIMMSNVSAVGFRHIMTVCAFAVFEIVLEHGRKIAVVFLGVCLCVSFFTRLDVDARTVHYADHEQVQQLEEVRKGFTEAMPRVDGLSWENTVAWMIEDHDDQGNRQVLSLRWIYAIPDGYGIQLDQIDHFDEQFSTLQSKYVLVLKGYTADKRLTEFGAEKLIDTEDYVLYLNPKYQ